MDEPALWQIYWQQRTVKNRNRLVVHFLPLVRPLMVSLVRANGYWFPVDQIDNLVSLGHERLIGLVESYKPGRKSFKSYLRQGLSRVLSQYIEDRDRQCRKPEQPTVSLEAVSAHNAQQARQRLPGLAVQKRPTGSAFFDQLTEGLDDLARRALWLQFYGKMSLTDIAEDCGCSTAQIQRVLVKAKALIRQRWGYDNACDLFNQTKQEDAV